MKKFLFSLFASAIIFSSAKAQTTFSFETSEGFSLGEIKGQNANIGTFHDTSAGTTGDGAVTNTEASVGANSLKLINSDDTNLGGIYITGIPFFTKTSVSYDIFVPALGGSDNYIELFDETGTFICAVDFTYVGDVDYYDDGFASTTIGSYTEAQWNHLEVQTDFSANTINILLNGSSIYSGAYGGAGTGISEVDFAIDNYGTDAYLDNIIVKDATLATDEVSAGKNSLKVFPNPMVDFVKVNTDGKVQSAQLFDASGKLVKTFRNASEAMNVADLKKGLYIMKVKTDKGTSSAKVIKK